MQRHFIKGIPDEVSVETFDRGTNTNWNMRKIEKGQSLHEIEMIMRLRNRSGVHEAELTAATLF